jgi:hypothetical protein
MRDRSGAVLERICSVVERSRRTASSLQQPQGFSWCGNESYQGPRHDGALILDLLGSVPTLESREALVKASSLSDSKLLAFTACSQFRHEVQPAPHVLARVLQSDEARPFFRDVLEYIGRKDLFPVQFDSEELRAREAMVRWLVHPCEWNCAPDEMKLMGTLSEFDGTVYIFKFITTSDHWSSKDGWTAGIAGPFKNGREAVASVTFSDFVAADSATPDEHAARIIAKLRK